MALVDDRGQMPKRQRRAALDEPGGRVPPVLPAAPSPAPPDSPSLYDWHEPAAATACCSGGGVGATQEQWEDCIQDASASGSGARGSSGLGYESEERHQRWQREAGDWAALDADEAPGDYEDEEADEAGEDEEPGGDADVLAARKQLRLCMGTQFPPGDAPRYELLRPLGQV